MTILLKLLLLVLPYSVALGAELRVAIGVASVADVAAAKIEPARGSAQSGGLTGFNEDLGREICRRMNAHCSFSNVQFPEMIPGLEAKRFDLGFGNFLRTPEREKRIAFSDMIWRSSSRLVGAPETAERVLRLSGKPVALDTVTNVRIVAIQETQQFQYLLTQAVPRGIEVVGVKSMAEAMNALTQNTADFALLPMLSAYALLSREAAGRYEFVGQPVSESGLGGSVHIGLEKTNPSLRLEVNQALTEMRGDGTYHRIVRRYFPFNLD